MANITNMLDVDKILTDVKLVVEYKDNLYMTQPIKDLYKFIFKVYPNVFCDYNHFARLIKIYGYKQLGELKKSDMPKSDLSRVLETSSEIITGRLTHES